MTFYYCDAPAGAGKTYALKKVAIKKVEQGKNVLIVQPTKDLIDETVSSLSGSGVYCHVIHSDHSDRSVIADITNYLKKPYHEPHILLITWSAFEQIPYVNRREDWHLFVDEVPQVNLHEPFNASISHRILTDHVSTHTLGPVYSCLAISDRTAVRKLSDEGASDHAAKLYGGFARKLLSNNWELYVDQAQFSGLLEGNKKRLSIFALMQPSILAGFASTTITAARFSETLLCKLWAARGVDFVPHKELTKELRYHSHSGGETIKIFYGFEKDWSKTFRDQDGKKFWTMYIDAINKEIGTQRLLWLANKDTKDNPFHENAQRLPNTPHGLNQYQYEYDAFAALSALNPTPDHFKFLEWKGIDAEEVRTATYRLQVYQAALRCSIRNPDNKIPKKIFVPDLATALWLQSIFIGSEIISLGIPIDQGSLKKKAGRPKKHQNDNDRKAAHRERELLRQEVIIDKIYHSPKKVIGTDDHEYQDSIKSCDENTLREINDNNLILEKDELLRFHGSLWDRKYATRPSHYGMFNSHEKLIQALRLMSKRKFSDKDEVKFISPTYFIEKEGIGTSRGEDNVAFSRGIWLDFDEGNITPKKFGSMFPKLRFVAYSTWSSTGSQPRWRAYIPTNGTMTPEQYTTITSEILLKIIGYGYHLKKVDPAKPEKLAHGLDLSKLVPASLFKLPCRTPDKTGSFFTDIREDRELLNVKEWLAFGHIQKEAEAEIEEVNSQPVSDADIQLYLKRWRETGTQKGNGDSEMYALTMDLYRLGLRGSRLEEILLTAASSAHSPKDRVRQVKRIMKSSR